MNGRVIYDPVMLAQWCSGRWQGPMPDRVMGFGNDSRVIQPGECYVAIRGERLDGHAFVGDALQRAASAALVDEDAAAQASADWPLLVVPDTRRALMDMARGHRDRCRATVIGITGSVGKTSVKEMLADVLAHLGPVTRTRGNWNNDIGFPLSILRLQPEDRFGVFEVGMNHPGELKPLCDIMKPDWGIITSIGPVHLAHFANVEAIVEEKATLLEALPEQGTAVLSMDDRWYDQLLTHVESRVLRVSLRDPQADYYGEWQTGDEPVLTVHDRATGDTRDYRMPLPGQYVADNALRAIAVAREMGVEPDVIAHALIHYRPLAMRWNRVTIAGVQFINDAYNANPMSMKAAIDAIQEMPASGRKWLVLAGMFELGATEQEEHEALGRYAAQFRWAGVLTVGRLGAMIAQGMMDAGLDTHTVLKSCADCQEAADVLKDAACPGDVILLKASRGERLESLLTCFEDLMASDNGVSL